jgi:hypothetical protein
VVEEDVVAVLQKVLGERELHPPDMRRAGRQDASVASPLNYKLDQSGYQNGNIIQQV